MPRAPKGEKRPADVNARAVLIAKIATGYLAAFAGERVLRHLERARYVAMKRRRSAGIRRLGGDLSVRSKSNQLDWFRRKRT